MNPIHWQREVAMGIAEELSGKTAYYNSSDLTTFPQHFQLLHEAASSVSVSGASEKWSEKMSSLIIMAHIGMRDAKSSFESTQWRTIFTESCLVLALVQSLTGLHLQAISTLDRAIIIAGPCGSGRLETILAIIKRIQTSVPETSAPNPTNRTVSPPLPQKSQGNIRCIPAPSFLAFQSTYSKFPFIIRNHARNWPAMNNHAWKNAGYLKSIAGPGRIVPVEVGNDYRATDWRQELMNWDDFLLTLDFDDQHCSKQSGAPVFYLAQHDLTKQFPEMRDDIIIPDYVYATLTPDDCADYRPPNNDDQIIFNTWLGPAGAMSPAHTDPYYNCFVQVVGCKLVWLAPPSASSSMYPFAPRLLDDVTDERMPSSGIGNTSKVDVFADGNVEEYPDFVQRVVPISMTATLCPGDMLFFPPGWWHAMKSVTTSLSFSMWF